MQQKPFLFREHRGSLQASMDTVITLKSMEELEAIAGGEVVVKPYGYDQRINWDTHIVTVGGNAVGFTNKAVKRERFRVHLSEMVESCGKSWWVTIDHPNRPLDASPTDSIGRITPFRSYNKGNAEIELEEWEAFFECRPVEYKW